MMVMCNKQHLSNIWSWIHGKVKQYWNKLKKSVAYKKSVYLNIKNCIKISFYFSPMLQNILFSGNMNMEFREKGEPKIGRASYGCSIVAKFISKIYSCIICIVTDCQKYIHVKDKCISEICEYLKSEINTCHKHMHVFSEMYDD